MTAVLEDLRYSLRALAKRPVYALVTVLVLSLAVGANTAVFSISNGFFMRPLPYPDGNRLVAVFNAYPGMGLDSTANSIPDYLDRRDRAPSLEQLALFANSPRTLSVDESPERLTLTRVSPSFFDVFRVPPMLGRGFTAEEAVPGNERVIVLSSTASGATARATAFANISGVHSGASRSRRIAESDRFLRRVRLVRDLREVEARFMFRGLANRNDSNLFATFRVSNRDNLILQEPQSEEPGFAIGFTIVLGCKRQATKYLLCIRKVDAVFLEICEPFRFVPCEHAAL